LVGVGRRTASTAKLERLDQARARLRALNLTPNEAQKHGIAVRLDGTRRTAFELLSLPDVDFPALAGIWPELHGIGPETVEQLETDARYAGYLDRQEADILAFRRDESLNLPDELDYAAVCGLSAEAVQKLAAIRPATLGQASRIDGVTPAALTLVLAHVKSARHAA
jgi:tRNA uridine 5-carboxymethylaminomethyl modification enzyme